MVLSLSGAILAAAAGADDIPGPLPTVCNAYAPAVNCFYAAVAGTDTFNIGTHILHIGQEVSGTYRWEIGGQGNGSMPAEGSVTVGSEGPGLKLIHCDGPHSDSNAAAKYGTDKASDITKGHTTCEWKAVAGTNGWVTTMGLGVDAGGEFFTAGDFYTVVDKGSIIDGNVRQQDVSDALKDLTGIAGAKVTVTGPDGFDEKTSTAGTGYYQISVPHPGTYTVKPDVPKSYWKGTKAKSADPPFAKLDVPDNKTVEADFVVKSTLKLELKVEKRSVPADGLSFVDATVTATDGGDPDPGLVFSLRPYGGGSALTSAWDMAVPATICTRTGRVVGGRLWPAPGATSPNTDSVSVTTDSEGKATFRIYPGTVPGTFPLTVWAENAKGGLDGDSLNTSADADINVTPISSGGDPTGAMENWLARPGGSSLATSLAAEGSNIDLVTTMADAMKAGQLAGFTLAPVQATGNSAQAVLMAPAGSRIKFDDKTGVISPTTEGRVLAPNNSLTTVSSFWGLVHSRQAPVFPTVPSWLTDKAPSYTFAGIMPPVTLTSGFGPLHYLGFSYLSDCT
jgi:hypothetical protein